MWSSRSPSRWWRGDLSACTLQSGTQRSQAPNPSRERLPADRRDRSLGCCPVGSSRNNCSSRASTSPMPVLAGLSTARNSRVWLAPAAWPVRSSTGRFFLSPGKSLLSPAGAGNSTQRSSCSAQATRSRVGMLDSASGHRSGIRCRHRCRMGCRMALLRCAVGCPAKPQGSCSSQGGTHGDGSGG